MTIRVGGHQRTVNPLMSDAVLKMLRHMLPITDQDLADQNTQDQNTDGQNLAELLASRSPTLSEDAHLQCLTALSKQSWLTIRSSARHLLDRPRDSVVDATLKSGDLKALLGLLAAMQLRFHAGHNTEFSFRENRVFVEHKALLGKPPAFAESVFVAAIHQVIAEACLGKPVPLHFQIDNHLTTPDELLAGMTRPTRAMEWQLTIPPTVEHTTTEHVSAVQTAVLLDPARAWRLADLASSVGCSDRTLQRRLSRAGTTASSLIIRARLDVARGLVERTTLTLADIAAATGFTDHAHLTNRYQSVFGCTPSSDRVRLVD